MNYTPEQIAQRLNAYNNGRGWHGVNDWIAVGDTGVCSSAWFINPNPLRQPDTILMIDAEAIVTGWDAKAEFGKQVVKMADERREVGMKLLTREAERDEARAENARLQQTLNRWQETGAKAK